MKTNSQPLAKLMSIKIHTPWTQFRSREMNAKCVVMKRLSQLNDGKLPVSSPSKSTASQRESIDSARIIFRLNRYLPSSIQTYILGLGEPWTFSLPFSVTREEYSNFRSLEKSFSSYINPKVVLGYQGMQGETWIRRIDQIGVLIVSNHEWQAESRARPSDTEDDYLQARPVMNRISINFLSISCPDQHLICNELW